MSTDVNKHSSGRLFIISFNVEAFFLIFFKIVEKRQKDYKCYFQRRGKFIYFSAGEDLG